MPESAAAGIYARGPGPGHKADKGGTLSLAATAPAAVVAAEFQPGFSQSVFESQLVCNQQPDTNDGSGLWSRQYSGNGSDPRK